MSLHDTYITQVAFKEIEEVVLVDEVRKTHIGIIFVAIEEKLACKVAHVLNKVGIKGSYW